MSHCCERALSFLSSLYTRPSSEASAPLAQREERRLEAVNTPLNAMAGSTTSSRFSTFLLFAMLGLAQGFENDHMCRRLKVHPSKEDPGKDCEVGSKATIWNGEVL